MNPNSPKAYGKAMKSAFKATKTFGMPQAKVKLSTPKVQMPKMKMSMSASTPMHKSKARSAASKLFGGKY